jgi:hypothetical protein
LQQFYKKEDDLASFKNQSIEYINFSGLDTVTGYIRTFKTNKKDDQLCPSDSQSNYDIHFSGLGKNVQRNKKMFDIFLKSKLLIPRPPFKGRPSFRRSHQPTKETSSTLKLDIS